MRRLALLCAIAWMPAAVAQAPADPVGHITEISSTVEKGVTVGIGHDANDRPLCFVRDEQDGGYKLDVGLGRWGAFARMQSPDPPESRLPASVRVLAGTAQLDDGKITGRFDAVARYAGTAIHSRFDVEGGGLTLVATDDPAGFLATIAAAHGGFVVIEPANGGAGRDWFHVYRFDRAAALALHACAEHLPGQK